MKYASLLCILCLALLANTCKKETFESQLLKKTWLHSFEEDQSDVLAYRPNTHDFPPSRGRTGFALEEGGVIKQYNIAPTDGLEERIGKWEFVENNKQVLVTMAGDGQPEERFTIEIVSLKDNLLKVRKLPVPAEN